MLAQPTVAQPATAARRLTAYLIDYVVILLLIAINVGLSFVLPSAWFDSPGRSQLVGFGLLTVPVWLYFASTEASRRQASIGKQVRGLRVVDAQTGERIQLSQSLLRSGIKFLPWELGHTMIWRIGVWPDSVTIGGNVAAVGLLLLMIAPMLVDPTRQAVWDRVAGTAVLTTR